MNVAVLFWKRYTSHKIYTKQRNFKSTIDFSLNEMKKAWLKIKEILPDRKFSTLT